MSHNILILEPLLILRTNPNGRKAKSQIFPKVLIKWNVIKMRTANTIGSPSPPFRIIAPNGALIKNIRIQEKAITKGNRKRQTEFSDFCPTTSAKS